MAFFPANFFLRTSQEDEHHRPTINAILPSCTAQDFHDAGGALPFLGKRCMSFSGVDLVGEEGNNGEDDLSDDGSQMGEKKKRLSMEQVKTLEKNFELGNKLEPGRKLQLARALGLQPRQIAIWFQNRRARWKTKQLEKDYDVLKRQFEAIKADNEALKSRNKRLQEEIMALKGREPTESINLNKETEGSSSNKSENSSEIKLDISMTAAIDSPSFRPLFPSSSSSKPPPPSMAHLFGTAQRQDDYLQWQKIDQMVKEENLGNMFCGIEDQSGFWPLLEHQQFNG